MRRFSTFLFALLLVLSGCDSGGDSDGDDDDPAIGNCAPNGAGLLVANVGGEQYCPFAVSADVSAGRVFVVGTAVFSDQPGTVLVVTAPASAGSYPLGSSDRVYASFYVRDERFSYDSDGAQATGSVTVSGISRDSTGTFLMDGSFSLVLDEFDEETDTYTGETITITNGTFDVRDTGI